MTVGTIFHHTHLPLQKWFLAVMLMLNAKKSLSVLQLSRCLHVNKNTRGGPRRVQKYKRTQDQRTGTFRMRGV